jgi:hypothetical protein
MKQNVSIEPAIAVCFLALYPLLEMKFAECYQFRSSNYFPIHPNSNYYETISTVSNYFVPWGC